MPFTPLSTNSLQSNDTEKRVNTLTLHGIMKASFKLTFLLTFLLISFCSCLKKEGPWPLPDPGQASVDEVDIGNDYATQIYYSFNNGIVKTNRYDLWDIAFDINNNNPELWMNGGKNLLIWPTGQSDFSFSLPSNANQKTWIYDQSSMKPGESGLGTLSPTNHLQELLFVRIGLQYYKLKILEVTNTHYVIQAGSKEDQVGTIYNIEKNDRYNFAYFSFQNGIVQPEPDKEEWDMLFTRYRTIFEGLNTDGSDLPYLVNGILINTYNTLGASDSTREFEFNQFHLADAESFTLSNERNAIGYNWKSVNINTGEYTILPKRMLLLQDQHQQLWKFHFVSFYDENGQRGKPKFEYERLK